MASFSSTYPSQRPVFTLDAANAGRLDSRMTFTRSDTPPTYAAPSAVHYWSNEKHLSSDNLFLQSSTFDNAAWSNNGITETAGQTDPSGGSSAYKLLENTSSSYHNVYQASSGNESWALTVYAKQNTGTRYLALRIYGAAVNNYETAVFDLAGSAPSVASGSSSGYTNVAATQTASGNGFYKCTLKATGSIAEASIHISQNSTATGLDQYGVAGYTGDGTSSIDIAFASLSSVGSTEYVPTTTQIARSYAPTLKSVATAGQPRFEYDPATDGQSAGTSRGILIEGQSTNLLTYSSNFANSSWVKIQTNIEAAAAIAPDGTLSASYLRAAADSSGGMNLFSSATITNNATVNGSVYIKKTGTDSHCAILIYNGGNQARQWFDLINKTTSTSYSVGSGFSVVNAGVEDVGNGWMRINVSASCTGTTAYIGIYPSVSSDGAFASTVASSNALLYGAQLTESSYPSSLISTSGSTATRAAESLSVATADIPGFSEGVGTVVYETGGVASATETNQLGFGLRADSANFFTAGVNNGGVTDASVRVYSKTSGGDQAFLNPGTATVGTGYKLACRFELDNIAASMNGGTVVSDTSGQVPVGVDTLWVGQLAGNYYLNSNIKRIALYNEALSDTNLQALTS